jgi:hypothetical protein
MNFSGCLGYPTHSTTQAVMLDKFEKKKNFNLPKIFTELSHSVFSCIGIIQIKNLRDAEYSVG